MMEHNIKMMMRMMNDDGGRKVVDGNIRLHWKYFYLFGVAIQSVHLSSSSSRPLKEGMNGVQCFCHFSRMDLYLVKVCLVIELVMYMNELPRFPLSLPCWRSRWWMESLDGVLPSCCSSYLILPASCSIFQIFSCCVDWLWWWRIWIWSWTWVWVWVKKSL